MGWLKMVKGDEEIASTPGIPARFHRPGLRTD